jgi:hypothetical protein
MRRRRIRRGLARKRILEGRLPTTRIACLSGYLRGFGRITYEV